MVNCDSEELFKSEGIIYLNSLPGNTVWSLTQVLINRKYKQFNLKISFQINNNTATELIRKSNNLGENIAREVYYLLYRNDWEGAVSDLSYKYVHIENWEAQTDGSSHALTEHPPAKYRDI